MQVSLDWKQGMTFDAVADSTHKLVVSADNDEAGAALGFRPMELMALSVGACTAIDVMSILNKKRQDVTDLQVRVNTEKQEAHPQVWTRVMVEYIVTGRNVDPVAVARAIELSHDKYCPAQNMIEKAVHIESRYEIHEVAS
jgi:putative redox protein